MVWTISYKRSRASTSEQDSPTLTRDVPSHDGLVRVRTVKAGSVEKLVEHLAPYRTEIDVSYRTCFLATYRTFITTTRLLQFLKDRSGVITVVSSCTCLRQKDTHCQTLTALDNIICIYMY